MKDKQKEIEMCRQVYEQPHMSEEQLQKMKDRIEEAKMDNRRGLKKMRAATVAAAAVAAFIILPNTSAGVAHAMEQIPVIGRLVNVVTFRDYQYEDERNQADIEIPEIVPEGVTDTVVEESADEVQTTLQKSADENKMYWLDDAEVEEWNFKQITDDTAFYLNEKGNIVISFDEGDVAPMYMGVVTFEIPEDVVKDFRK